MNSINISVIGVMAKNLKPGMHILNLGIVKKVKKGINQTEIQLFSSLRVIDLSSIDVPNFDLSTIYVPNFDVLTCYAMDDKPEIISKYMKKHLAK